MHRRTLAAGISAIPNVDAEEALRFVKSGPGLTVHSAVGTAHSTDSAPPREQMNSSRLTPVGLISITVRLRPDVAAALKRASLQRELDGESVFTQQELVQQALEPWLRENGYLA